VTSHVLNFEFQLVLRALLGALEGEMLEEVGGTVGLVGFGAGAGIDPDADGRGLGEGGVLGGDLEKSVSAGGEMAILNSHIR
jgi:hypothetical protein